MSSVMKISSQPITLGQLQDGQMFRMVDIERLIYTRIRPITDKYVEVERPWDKERFTITTLTPVKLPGIYYTGLTLGELEPGDKFQLPGNKNTFTVEEQWSGNLTAVDGADGRGAAWYKCTQVLKVQLTLF